MEDDIKLRQLRQLLSRALVVHDAAGKARPFSQEAFSASAAKVREAYRAWEDAMVVEEVTSE